MRFTLASLCNLAAQRDPDYHPKDRACSSPQGTDDLQHLHARRDLLRLGCVVLLWQVVASGSRESQTEQAKQSARLRKRSKDAEKQYEGARQSDLQTLLKELCDADRSPRRIAESTPSHRSRSPAPRRNATPLERSPPIGKRRSTRRGAALNAQAELRSSMAFSGS